jgi:hypothetical protein
MALFMIRLHELEAIHQMEKIEQTEIFANAFNKSAKMPEELAQDRVQEPAKTVKGIASEVSQWFQNIGQAGWYPPRRSLLSVGIVRRF